MMIPLHMFAAGDPPSFSLEERIDQANRIDSVIRAYYPEDTVPGLVVSVLEGGHVWYQKGYGVSDLDAGEPNGTHTRFRMASVSKQFTAMAVYRLIEQGKLSFDTPLGQVLEGFSAGPSAVTIAQLLTHTSGIWDYEGLIPAGRREQVSDADVLEMVRTQPQTYFEPGMQFRYSNTGFCLLSLVVEKISGQSYPKFVKEQIFVPAGIPGAYLYEAGNPMIDRAFGYRPVPEGFRFADQSVTSATKGDGCVYVSAEEYQRWAGCLMDGSFPSVEYLQAIVSMKQPVRDNIYYSLGWFVAPPFADEGLRLFHSGETTGFRNIVYLNVSKKRCISIFANQDDPKIAQVFEQIMKLLGEQNPVVQDNGTPPVLPLFLWMSNNY